VKINPGSGNSYANLTYAYQWINQLDQAKATAQESPGGRPLFAGSYLSSEFSPRTAAHLEQPKDAWDEF
jgi:hypothetical protein